MTTKTASTETRESTCRCGCGEPVTRLFKQGHDQRLVSLLASDLVYLDVWDGRCLGILTKSDAKTDIQGRIDKVVGYVRVKLSEALGTKVYNAAMRAWELEKTRDQRAAAKAERKAAANAKPKRARKTSGQRAVDAATKGSVPSEVAGDAPEAGAVPADKSRVGRVVTATASNADVDAAEAAMEEAATNGAVMGQAIKVKVGKRSRTAYVHGMNQAGKVTAVRLVTSGVESIKTEGQFTIVNG